MLTDSLQDFNRLVPSFVRSQCPPAAANEVRTQETKKSLRERGDEDITQCALSIFNLFKFRNLLQ